MKLAGSSLSVCPQNETLYRRCLLPPSINISINLAKIKIKMKLFNTLKILLKIMSIQQEKQSIIMGGWTLQKVVL